MSPKPSSSSSSSSSSDKKQEGPRNISDQLYTYNKEDQKNVLRSRPWKEDPHYFTNVKISGLAVLKMVMHTISGVPLEVMGMLQGKIENRTFIVTDAFALPIKGTETRVDAMDEALGYMSEYTNLIGKVGRVENVVGWYHSHPGYGCWLSGIDTNTQMQQQKFLDPFLAVVVDPVRTISSGKVEIGAFRTFPEGYKPSSTSQDSEYQSIPLDKISDFGVYADMYYKLNLQMFKSTTDTSMLDLLWSKYWVNTLSSSPLVTNRDYTNNQMLDLAEKIEKAESEVQSSKMSFMPEREGKQKKESSLSKLTKDSNKISVEVLHGIIAQVTKDALFNHGPL